MSIKTSEIKHHKLLEGATGLTYHSRCRPHVTVGEVPQSLNPIETVSSEGSAVSAPSKTSNSPSLWATWGAKIAQATVAHVTALGAACGALLGFIIEEGLELPRGTLLAPGAYLFGTGSSFLATWATSPSAQKTEVSVAKEENKAQSPETEIIKPDESKRSDLASSKPEALKKEEATDTNTIDSPEKLVEVIKGTVNEVTPPVQEAPKNEGTKEFQSPEELQEAIAGTINETVAPVAASPSNPESEKFDSPKKLGEAIADAVAQLSRPNETVGGNTATVSSQIPSLEETLKGLKAINDAVAARSRTEAPRVSERTALPSEREQNLLDRIARLERDLHGAGPSSQYPGFSFFNPSYSYMLPLMLMGMPLMTTAFMMPFMMGGMMAPMAFHSATTLGGTVIGSTSMVAGGLGAGMATSFLPMLGILGIGGLALYLAYKASSMPPAPQRAMAA